MTRSALALCVAASAIAPACASDDPNDDPNDEIVSPCKAFARAPTPTYELEPFAIVPDAVAVVAARGGKPYVLDRTGKLHVLTPRRALAVDLGPTVRAAAVAPDGSLYVLRDDLEARLELVRYTSIDDGATFDATGVSTVAAIAAGAGPGGAIAVDSGGAWVATPDATGASVAQDAASLLGKVLRIESEDEPPVVFARGFRSPLGITFDAYTGDLWVTDAGESGVEVDRVLRDASYGWPILDGIRCFTPAEGCTREPHVRPVAIVEGATSGAIVHRGGVTPLAGTLVLGASDVTAVVPFGASGPAQVRRLGFGARAVGQGPDGELLAITDSGVARVKDVEPAVPLSLVATGCFDLAAPTGTPLGAIPYDVASPLWSDGADKTRFVVVPKGARGAVRAGGDLELPVGTVAVKTFVVDGQRVETRLLVQHAPETWVGYSYAWNENGSDADLVVGARRTLFPSGKSWYFPSTEDCAACHTPAAGYTLGLEARQLAGQPAALDAIDKKLLAPIDRGRYGTPFPGAGNAGATAEARARSYLHANCSMCHRPESITGAADLDLRFDTPLAETKLCAPPNAGSFGIADARIVAPKAPARSVLLHRMNALDDARMPKLASHVVDQAGVAAVTEWIDSLAVCP